MSVYLLFHSPSLSPALPLPSLSFNLRTILISCSLPFSLLQIKSGQDWSCLPFVFWYATQQRLLSQILHAYHMFWRYVRSKYTFQSFNLMILNLVCILIFICALITKISFFPDVNKKMSNWSIITYLFVSIFIDLFNCLFVYLFIYSLFWLSLSLIVSYIFPVHFTFHFRTGHYRKGWQSRWGNRSIHSRCATGKILRTFSS